MDGEYLFLAEMALTLGAVLAWGWWQLRALRRDREDGPTARDETTQATRRRHR